MNKQIKKILAAVAGVVALGAMAHAAPYTVTKSNQGVYFTTIGDVSFANSADAYENGGNATESTQLHAKINPKVGFGTAFAVGYRISGIRIEGEYAYRRIGVDNIEADGLTRNAAGTVTYNASVTDQDPKSHFGFHSLMCNVLYDLYMTDSAYWYNGVGLGVARATFDSDGDRGSRTALAYQFMTGFGYDINKSVSLLLGYRLFTTVGKIDSEDDWGTYKLTGDIETPYIHSVEAGVRFNF